jgi:hypothetical protein
MTRGNVKRGAFADPKIAGDDKGIPAPLLEPTVGLAKDKLEQAPKYNKANGCS